MTVLIGGDASRMNPDQNDRILAQKARG